MTAVGYLSFVRGHAFPIVVSTRFHPANIIWYRGDCDRSNIVQFGPYLADIVTNYQPSCCYH